MLESDCLSHLVDSISFCFAQLEGCAKSSEAFLAILIKIVFASLNFILYQVGIANFISKCYHTQNLVVTLDNYVSNTSL